MATQNIEIGKDWVDITTAASLVLDQKYRIGNPTKADVLLAESELEPTLALGRPMPRVLDQGFLQGNTEKLWARTYPSSVETTAILSIDLAV